MSEGEHTCVDVDPPKQRRLSPAFSLTECIRLAEPDWVLEFAASMKKPAPLVTSSSMRPKHPKRRKVDPAVAKKSEVCKKKESSCTAKTETAEDLILEEYDSDAAVRAKKKGRGGRYDSSSSDSDEDEEAEEHVLKVYYVSRTHTQLTQFIREARGTTFGKVLR